MAVDYKKIGLVNTKDMFARAIKGGWAVPAFNFNNLEQLQAIIQASSNLKSPVILQVSKGARKYANPTLLRYMAEGAVEYAKELGCNHPEIVLHLDHGDSFETCKDCVDFGFSSVMIDGSALPYEENIALTKKVVDYAHQFGVTVEGELGILIEHFAGAFPTWLAPVQVKVLPISDKYMDYAQSVLNKLTEAGIRAEVDTRAEKIGYKIREAQTAKIPYMLVVGQKEEEENTVSVRSRAAGDEGARSLDMFIADILKEIETKENRVKKD